MSQHRFNTSYKGQPVEILMGWDRPLQGFFLVIQKLNPQSTLIYSNLDDENLEPDGLSRDLGYFRNKLNQLGIIVPEQMWDEIKSDQLDNIGNRYETYS